jgi:hypothetical protein
MTPQPVDPTVATLQGILAAHPNADLQALLSTAKARHP